MGKSLSISTEDDEKEEQLMPSTGFFGFCEVFWLLSASAPDIHTSSVNATLSAAFDWLVNKVLRDSLHL